MNTSKQPTNSEGLTLDEWMRAACAYRLFDPDDYAKLKRAWRAGEDPTEWAAHYAHEARETYETAMKDAGRA